MLLQIAKITTGNKGWLFLFKRHWKASINIIQDRTNEGLFPREEEGKGAPTASEDALNAHHTPSWPTSESSPHSEFMISVPLQVCVRAALCLETFCWQGDWKQCINASASVLTLESLGGTLYFSKKFQQNKLPTNVYSRGLDNSPSCFLFPISCPIVTSPLHCFLGSPGKYATCTQVPTSGSAFGENPS